MATSMKETFKQMVAYYYHHLLEEGCSDPKKVIAEDFISAISFEKAQKDYLKEKTNAELELKVVKHLLGYIEAMKEGKQELNNTSLDTIENGLKLLDF